MIRYVSGIDQPIYPIAYIKNKIPIPKRSAVCSYTAESRNTGGQAYCVGDIITFQAVLTAINTASLSPFVKKVHEAVDIYVFDHKYNWCIFSSSEFKCETDFHIFLSGEL